MKTINLSFDGLSLKLLFLNLINILTKSFLVFNIMFTFIYILTNTIFKRFTTNFKLLIPQTDLKYSTVHCILVLSY